MIIGYAIFGKDNGGHLFPSGYGKSICEVLDFVQNRHQYLTSEFSIKRTDLSFSHTYDSALIINKKFKDFCFSNKYEGLNFYPLPNLKGFYLLKVENAVVFDFQRRGTKFEDLKEHCGKYNSVAGATPICLKINKPLLDGIFRTDIEFGTGYEQSPLIVIGTKTYFKMQQEMFNDFNYEEILDSYDWEK